MSVAMDERELFETLKSPLAVVYNMLTVEDGRPYGVAAQPWQRRFFEAVAAEKPDGAPEHRLLFEERRRGESKSADAAAALLADLITGPRQHKSYAVAGDTDQAALLIDSIQGFRDRNALVAQLVRVQRHVVRNSHTGSELRVMSSDDRTAFGLRVRKVAFDELSLQVDDRLWLAFWTAIAKRRDSQLIALTMAGSDFSSIAWKVREMARSTPNFYFGTRAGSEPAPWLSAEAIEEQRQTLHPLDFKRYWLCEWCEPAGSWISREMYDAAEKGRESYRGDEQFSYVAFIDVGLTHDPTVIAVAHAEGDRAVLDTLKTFQGSKGQPVELEAVEQEVIRLARRYHLRSVRFESPQAVASSQRLSKRLSCNVGFRHPTADSQATLWGNAYRLFSNGLITIYPHEQLRREALSLVTRTVSGRLKVVDSGSIHQDHVLSVAGACEMLLEDIDFDPQQNLPLVAVARAGMDGVRRVMDTVGSLFTADDTDEDPVPSAGDAEELVHHPGVFDRAGRPAASHPSGRSCGICEKARLDNTVRAGTSWPAVAISGSVIRIGRIGKEILNDVEDPHLRAELLSDPEGVLCGFCQRALRDGHRSDCPEFSLVGPGEARAGCGCRSRAGHEADCPVAADIYNCDPGEW